MIKIISPKAGDEFIQTTVSLLPVSIIIGPLSSFGSVEGTPPVDLGYLNQGCVADEFGNKIVEHVNLDGEIVLVGTDMAYDPTVGWPVASLTGNGFQVWGCKRSRPTERTYIQGCAFVDGTPGSASLGGRFDESMFPTSSGYSEFIVSWKNYGRTVDIRVQCVGYLKEAGDVWVKIQGVSHTRLIISPTDGSYQKLSSKPGLLETYSDGRCFSQQEEVFCYSSDKEADWLTYEGASPTLNCALGISPGFSALMKDAYDKYLQTNEVWPELCQKAILSGQYVDCNMIAMINDLKNLRADLTDIMQSAKKLPKAKLATKQGWKDVSSFFLGNKYGYQLTYADAGAIGESLERLRQDIKMGYREIKKLTSASTSTISGKIPFTIENHYTAKVGSSNDPLMMAIKGLYDWDLYPSLGNMWDLIPYSFCVDWVAGIGDLLDDIDANVYMRYYQARSIMKSTKITTGPVDNQQILGSIPGACGLVSYTYYRRWVEFTFDPMPLSVDFHPENLLGHWVEGASLIIQRT
nr:MAG: putative maturation protein [StochSev_2 levi-like virus]